MEKFKLGDHVKKIKGSQWSGLVVGTYSTALTPEGYAVESSTEKGSVQIYPAAALSLIAGEVEPTIEEMIYQTFPSDGSTSIALLEYMNGVKYALKQAYEKKEMAQIVRYYKNTYFSKGNNAICDIVETTNANN